MSSIKSVKKVANDGLQAEIVDLVVKEGVVNVLAALNKGDERFRVGSERRAWFPVTVQSLAEIGFSKGQLDAIVALEFGGKIECDVKDPKIDGHTLRIQIVESIVPDVYQRQNTAKTAKQLEITDEVAANDKLNTPYDLKNFVGQQGYFLDADGNYIFSRSTVTIEGQVKHKFVSGELIPETMLSDYGASLAPASAVNNTVEEEA